MMTSYHAKEKNNEKERDRRRTTTGNSKTRNKPEQTKKNI